MPKYISDLIPPVILAVIVLAGLEVIFAVANASSPPVPCTLSPCSLSLNISWDTAGKPDTRPGTWGNTDSVSSEIPFVNVPAGYLVAITHVSGDEIAAPHGAMAPNGMAYALVGLTSTTPYQSPYVGPGLGSEGTFLYKQTPISQGGARIPINENVIGTLNADNIAVVKQAMFLDTAGASLHLEATLVLQFEYVKQ
jgi:hypothetical protein